MRLLYATTIVYPSTLANRIQILKTSAALEGVLANDFLLCGTDIKLDTSFTNKNIYNFGTKISKNSLNMGLRYVLKAKREGFTHVFVREEMLLIFIYLFSKVLYPSLIISYEAHWMYNATKKVINKLFSYVIRHTHFTFTTTLGLKTEIAERYSYDFDKIIVLPDAVDVESYNVSYDKNLFRQNLNIDADHTVVTYVGTYKTLGEGKGVDLLVDAFVKLKQKTDKKIFLQIIGVGEQGSVELKNVLNNANINSSDYNIIGRVDFKDVPYYLQISDVAVMPFPKNHHYENYMSPMKLFEYMASRVPIITTDLKSVREILPDERYCKYVNPDSSYEIEKGILEIINNKPKALDMANNAYNEVLQYTWKKRSEKIIKTIR